MAMTCSLDWRQGLVSATVATGPGGGMRLTLSHAAHELVIALSPESLDALTWACLRMPRESREGRDDR